MKKSLAAFLIIIFMMPAFGPWMPHSALQALHVQEKHHDESSVHGNHSHEPDTDAGHSVYFDVVTYFSDYLQVELKNADHADLKKPVLDAQKVELMQSAVLIPPAFAPSSHNQITGPPLNRWRFTQPGHPVYLTTQRLRI